MTLTIVIETSLGKALIFTGTLIFTSIIRTISSCYDKYRINK